MVLSPILCRNQRKTPPEVRRHVVLQLLFLAFALLVCDTAAGLACGLAGSLAFAAAAVLCGLAKILSSESLDVLHEYVLQN